MICPIQRSLLDIIRLPNVPSKGFDAMTGSINKLDIIGKDGLTMKKAWEAGPVQYLGLLVNGFPNMFIVTGPGSPSVLTNMIVSIEQQSEWITDAIVKMRNEGVKAIEASEESQREWVKFVNSIAEGTLFYSCSSWYLGANIPGEIWFALILAFDLALTLVSNTIGKPRIFMPMVGLPVLVATIRFHC